jgi:hypothetical protein
MEKEIKDNTYFDIVLEKFENFKLCNNVKVLVLGNKTEHKKTMAKLLNYTRECYFKKSHTFITRDKNVIDELDKKDLMLYYKFAPLLTSRCFSNNWLVYIDSEDYSIEDVSVMQDNMKEKKQTVILYDDPSVNVCTYLGSSIDFDYIFLFDAGYFETTYERTAKYPQYFHFKQTNLDRSFIRIYTKDIIELIHTMDKHNEINEKMYLVYDVKKQKLLYLTI